MIQNLPSFHVSTVFAIAAFTTPTIIDKILTIQIGTLLSQQQVYCVKNTRKREACLGSKAEERQPGNHPIGFFFN
jgi:hypothetical protein